MSLSFLIHHVECRRRKFIKQRRQSDLVVVTAYRIRVMTVYFYPFAGQITQQSLCFLAEYIEKTE